MVDDGVNLFLEWCDSQQIVRDKVVVGNHNLRGRCLFSAQACAEGDVLVFVPNVAHMTVDTSCSDYKCSHWMMQLVHKLLEEDALGSASAFAPFVSLLLDGSDTPPDVAAWAKLLPGSAGRMAQKRATKRSGDLKELCDCLPGCSSERALRAVHAVDSHSLWCKDGGLRALVPYFDLMNHDPQPSAHWVMDPPNFHLRVVANRAMGPNEEVTILYDGLSNARLLINYGFALAGPGPHQQIEFRACVPPQSVVIGERSAFESDPRAAEAEILIRADGTVIKRAALVPLLKAAREQTIDSEEPNADETLLARTLLQQAQAEQTLWHDLLDHEAALSDSRLVCLATSNRSILACFSNKLVAWLAAPSPQSLINSLGVPVTISSSESENESATSPRLEVRP